MTQLLIKLFIKDYDKTGEINVRKRYGILSGIVGVIFNIILFALKFFAGTLTSSIALTADAFNNLSDAASAVVTLVGFRLAARPADKSHPFGHGRIEYVSGLIVSMVIIMMGVELIRSSIDKMLHPESVEINMVSSVIIILSIFIKAWVYLFNRKIAKSINSSAIHATSMDSLSDVVATLVVFICMIITHLTGVNIDGIAGILVALFIIYTGYSTAKETLDPLLGQSPSPDLIDKIRAEVMSFEQISGVHDIMVHNYGPNKTLISLHAEVPCDIDIIEIHDTIDMAERRINKMFDCETVIHMDPIATNDKDINDKKDAVLSIVKSIDESITIHDFTFSPGEHKSNLIFDVVIPDNFKLSDTEVVKIISDKIKDIDESYNAIINVDKAFYN